MKDFFTRYRESKKHHYILPAVFWVMFGFAIVAQITGTDIDLASLQANVLEAGKEKPNYDADLIMEKKDWVMLLRIGKSAKNVETLNFSILGDPSVLKAVTSSDAQTSIDANQEGIFLIKVRLDRSIEAGEVITTLSPNLVWNTPLTMIDAGFTSSGSAYSLSTKTE